MRLGSGSGSGSGSDIVWSPPDVSGGVGRAVRDHLGRDSSSGSRAGVTVGCAAPPR